MPLQPFTPGQVDLEKIVRPFSTVINTPSRGRPGEQNVDPEHTTTTTEPALVVLEWSARAGVQTTDLPSLGVILNSDDDNDSEGILDEFDRTSHTVRVTNPDDPEQFVDVEVADSITLTNRAKKKRKWNLSS